MHSLFGCSFNVCVCVCVLQVRWGLSWASPVQSPTNTEENFVTPEKEATPPQQQQQKQKQQQQPLTVTTTGGGAEQNQIQIQNQNQKEFQFQNTERESRRNAVSLQPNQKQVLTSEFQSEELPPAEAAEEYWRRTTQGRGRKRASSGAGVLSLDAAPIVPPTRPLAPQQTNVQQFESGLGHQQGQPRSPYENVRAILRQGRAQQSSVVDRYYSQQRQLADQYRSSYSGGEANRRSTPGRVSYSSYMDVGRGTPPGNYMSDFRAIETPPPRLQALEGQGGDLAGTFQANGGTTAVNAGSSQPSSSAMVPVQRHGEEALRSPVHAFQRRSNWTPMRPSSSSAASRMKTLKRSFATATSQQETGLFGEQQDPVLGGAFKSPKRLRGKESTPKTPVYTRSSLLTPQHGDRSAQASPKGAPQLTTETAKRILSTLDSLTSSMGDKSENAARKQDAAIIPQKLKFNMPEAEIASPPPPVDSLRHFSETKAGTGTTGTTQKAIASEGRSKKDGGAPKKWPAAFLAANKANADKAIDSVEKEIEAAKGGLPKPSTHSKKPVFNFGQSKPGGQAPPSPIFGLQAPPKPKEDQKSGFEFTFAKKGITFGAPKTMEAKDASQGAGKDRTYTFGVMKLTEKEEKLAKAIQSVSGSVPASDRTFSFGAGKGKPATGGLEKESALLKKANEAAVKAAALPLPDDDDEEETKEDSPAPAAAPQVKKWPSSFLANNKKQNDSAVAAVAEEIEKAKNPPPTIAASKPGVPTFNFGAPPSTEAKEEAKSKFVFGSGPSPFGDTKKPASFTFGSTPAKDPVLPSSKKVSFSFGEAKPSESKDAEKPVEEAPKQLGFSFGGGSSSSSIVTSSSGFMFGKQDQADGKASNKRKSEDDAPEAKKPAFSFGAPVQPVPVSVEKPKEAATTTGAGVSSPFNFGSSTPANLPSFGFGSVSTAGKNESTKAPEAPEKKDSKDASDSTKVSAPVFAFGGGSSQSSTIAAFGSSKPAETPASTAAPAITPSPFSFTASAAPDKSQPEAVGKSSFTSASTGSTFQFGATSSSQFSAGVQSSAATNSTPFSFGASSSSSDSKGFGQAGSFGLGAAAPFGGQSQAAAPPTPSPFGGTNSTSSAPAFVFGQNASTESKPGPSFGSSGASPFGTATTGASFSSGFGASSASVGSFGAQTQAAATPSFSFGASAPVASSAMPSFGSSAPAPAFGSMQPAFGASAPASGNFAFGASQPQQPSFGGAAAPTPTPAFGSQMPAVQQQNAPSFGGFGSPMPAAPGGFSMGVGSSGTPPAGRRKVKAKPSWRKK